jgi:hypothetical protein
VGVSSDEIAAHGNEDHSLGNVETFFVVSPVATPSDHPTEGALYDPAARQDL